MKEVGSVIGIGESRVSQIHTEALVRLRARMHEVMAMHPAAATAASARGRR
jgi:DNA-directed RNA polymerase sigma subunit (sigma70/sigma32)